MSVEIWTRSIDLRFNCGLTNLANARGESLALPGGLALEMNRIALANESSESSDNMINAWSRLTDVGVPTTVACGALDANHILLRSEEFCRRIPVARYLVLNGMAHLPYLEDPLAVAELVIGSISDPSSLF
jgi:pimeloyl-ACP methyl ester carboxylesterase